MHKLIFTALLYCLVGCGNEEKLIASDLPVFQDYPETINATAATGQLLRKGNCVIFVRADGYRFIPIFRQGYTLAKVEQQFGNLNEPREVTVSGYNVIKPIPPNLVKALTKHDCDGTPIFYGSLLPGRFAPAAPQS